MFCENDGINKPHDSTINNNSIKVFIISRGKTVLFISMKTQSFIIGI
jgi:hypothetical protein